MGLFRGLVRRGLRSLSCQVGLSSGLLGSWRSLLGYMGVEFVSGVALNSSGVF